MTLFKFSISEEKLIQRINKSDATAFKVLFEMYYKRIVSYFMTRLNNKEESEDMAQQVFLRVWNSRKTIDSSKKFSSLIFTISKHILIDYFRINKPITEEFSELNERVEVSSVSKSEDVEDMLILLSKAQRITFLLNRLDGFTYNEIAEILSISVKTVEKRISVALKILSSQT